MQILHYYSVTEYTNGDMNEDNKVNSKLMTVIMSIGHYYNQKRIIISIGKDCLKEVIILIYHYERR